MSSSSRLDWLDAARGVSIVLIVLFHATDWLAGFHRAADVYVQINLFFRPVRVPLFFLISGILAARYMSLGWREFLSGRVALFLYLYGVWSVINWLYFRQYDDGVHRVVFGKSVEQLVTFWYDPIIGLWFIWSLAIYYVVTKLLAGLSPDIGAVAASLVSIGFFTYYVRGLSVPHINLFWYFAFFYVGVKYGAPVATAVGRNPLAICAAGALGFVCVGLTIRGLPPDHYKNGIVFGCLRFTLSVLGTGTAAAAAVIVCRLAPVSTALGFVGRRTISIYVVNEIVVSIAALAFSYPWAEAAWVKFASVPIVATSVIALALALRVLTDRLGLRWLYEIPAFAPRSREPFRLQLRHVAGAWRAGPRRGAPPVTRSPPIPRADRSGSASRDGRPRASGDPAGPGRR